MTNIGLDIGYSATKLVSSGGIEIFPSIVGTPDISRFSFNKSNNTIIGWDDKSWLVGTSALEQSRMLKRREDRDWITTPEYKTLFYSALAKLPVGNINLVTGLPIAFYNDAEKLLNLVNGKHNFTVNGAEVEYNVENVDVIPQPFGSLFSVVLSRKGKVKDSKLAEGVVGVVDCGGKTTNILTVSRMAEVAKDTASVNVGGWDIMRAVKDRLTNEYPDIPLRDHQIINAIINKSIHYFGNDVDISNLVSEIVDPLADTIIAQCGQLWGTGAGLDSVLISGGGALLMSDRLLSHFPHGVVVDDPVFANAIGYWKYSRMLKEDK